MPCELCGGGDAWIKTCLTPEGSRLMVCDPCYGEHKTVLTIVSGDPGDGPLRRLRKLRQPQGVLRSEARRTQGLLPVVC